MLATASTPNVDVHSMHDLVKTVQRLTEAFAESSLARGSIDVVTESREDRENRIEEERIQRQEDRKRVQLQHLRYIADTKGTGSDQYARLAANARMLGIEVPEEGKEEEEKSE